MKNNSKMIAEIALCVAIICVLSQISIPMPFGVPITLQTFAVAFCGYYLGAKRGAFAICAYVLLGISGAPVFASFKAGVQAVAGATGGFIIGFIPFTICCGLTYGKNTIKAFLSGILGLIICHIIGAIQFSFVTDYTFIRSLVLVSLPFIIKDVLSVVFAMKFATSVKTALFGDKRK